MGKQKGKDMGVSKLRFRYSSMGWFYRADPSEVWALRELPGLRAVQCETGTLHEVGPFRSLPDAYDGVRWRIAA